MNKKVTGIVAAVVLVLSSCGSDDKAPVTGSGSVQFSFGVNPDVAVSSSAGTGGGNSTGTDVPSPEAFSVRMSSEDGSYSKEWTSIADFPVDEQFRTGNYMLEAYYGSLEEEGFGKPYYYGSCKFTVSEASVTPVSLTCSLANTMISIDYTDAFKGYFTDYATTLHSDGGAHVVYGKDESRPAYLRPGDITMNLSLTLPNGSTTMFQPAMIENALARHHYHVMMDVNSGNMGTTQLVITFDDALSTEDFTIDLSDELMSSPAPEISTEGFVPGEQLSLIESQGLEYQVKMIINARAGLTSVIMTTSSSSLLASGWPAEIDLMAASEAERAKITGMGMRVEGLWNNPDKMAMIEFSGVLSRLMYDETKPVSSFTVVAKDKLTKVSEPVTLSVEVTPVNVTVESTSRVTVGSDRATIVLRSAEALRTDRLTVELCTENGVWENAETMSVTENAEGAGLYTVEFSVPEGVADVPVRVKYSGNIKAETTIKRQAPNFRIEADAFAKQAVVRILTDDASLLPFLTRNASVYAGSVKCTVVSRDIETGTVTVTGLNPTTSYSMKATVMEGNANPSYCDAVGIYTEGMSPIPNGDFEEIDDLIDYEGLFSGGRYSTSTVAIINQQNVTTLDVDFPKDWASVNAKTFCDAASNKNTWYMQPSAVIVTDKYSGTKAMKLSSVAWDVNGAPIPDYIQEGTPYVKYNKNIPAISHRAAGKLFLGGYWFDASSLGEAYNEGIDFASRPSALNGYFKYTPSAADYNDKGLVTVRVMGVADGKEVVIAEEKAELPAASDYTAFSLPIRYRMFGVKATRIQVMAASSKHVGTIAEETSAVKTVPDCVSASSTGSVLWVDNLSFSY